MAQSKESAGESRGEGAEKLLVLSARGDNLASRHLPLRSGILGVCERGQYDRPRVHLWGVGSDIHSPAGWTTLALSQSFPELLASGWTPGQLS